MKTGVHYIQSDLSHTYKNSTAEFTICQTNTHKQTYMQSHTHRYIDTRIDTERYPYPNKALCFWVYMRAGCLVVRCFAFQACLVRTSSVTLLTWRWGPMWPSFMQQHTQLKQRLLRHSVWACVLVQWWPVIEQLIRPCCPVTHKQSSMTSRPHTEPQIRHTGQSRTLSKTHKDFSMVKHKLLQNAHKGFDVLSTNLSIWHWSGSHHHRYELLGLKPF